MKYHGYLLKESFKDTTIIDKLTVSNAETYPCPEHMKADYMDEFWTGIAFEGELGDSDRIAEMLSKAVKTKGWSI